MKVLFILWLLSIASAKDKTCGNGIIPFSGFKVIRQYRLSMSGFKPLSQEFMALIHCDNGKEDYKTILKVESITQIDWNKSVCIYKPRISPYENNIERVHSYDSKNGSLLQDSEMAAKKHETKLSSSFITYIKDIFDQVLETVTKNKPLVYTGRKTNQHIEDIESSTVEASMKWESRNLVCYKLSRRKKYSRSNLSFFVPQTFVGGIYECIISPTAREDIFKTFKLPQSIHAFEVQCDPLLSRPILPLLADASINQWWDINYNIFSPSATHNIPYLKTPDPTNIRFGIHKTPELQGWADRIDVNEAYDFTDFEPHVLSLAISATTDFIFKTLKPIDFGKLLKQQTKFSLAGQPISENDLVINTVKKLSVDQKLALLLSVEPLKYEKILEKMQSYWDLFK